MKKPKHLSSGSMPRKVAISFESRAALCHEDQ